MLFHNQNRHHHSLTNGFPKNGFTLVELLVVIAIIGVLVALLLPAVQSAREAARMSSCKNNEKQLVLAMLNYEAAHRVFPTGEIHGGDWMHDYTSGYNGKNHCEWDGKIGIWGCLIFPFIERQNEYDQLDFSAHKQYSTINNRIVMQMKLPTFLCPSDPYSGLTTNWGAGGANNRARIQHYYAVNGSIEASTMAHPGDQTVSYSHCNANDGMFYNDSRMTIANLTDGMSNTAAICEVWGRTSINHDSPTESSRGMNLHTAVYFDWTPNSNRTNPWKANSFHQGGVHIANADGSVHFVRDNIPKALFQALATVSKGETVDFGW